ncbi:hypothetical protein CIPAW_15G056800 [Carya illinoinensis]|uniref:Uncharacterized protein n=1 Tax=Carya illinoinensis TaxID=32201 RepID=A0A8T1NBV6_CARIL|nr:hypothetical protein CIPAW_15G056800 [Carya illinoinensis]
MMAGRGDRYPSNMCRTGESVSRVRMSIDTLGNRSKVKS